MGDPMTPRLKQWHRLAIQLPNLQEFQARLRERWQRREII